MEINQNVLCSRGDSHRSRWIVFLVKMRPTKQAEHSHVSIYGGGSWSGVIDETFIFEIILQNLGDGLKKFL